MNFIIFFTIFFTLYGLLNYYIFLRGLQSIPQNSPLRVYYIIIFLFISLSFVLGRLLENYWLSSISNVLIWIGSFWFAAMLYFILPLVVIDIARLLNALFSVFPKMIINNYLHIKGLLAIVISVLVFIIISIGYWNARYPVIKEINIKIPKVSIGEKSIDLVIVSDIHLGTIVGKERFDKIVAMINSLKADIVLLPGDIVDEDIESAIRDQLGASLKSIYSKYGIFAVTGNHEYIGGVERACRYLIENNVRVLRDESMLINNSIYLVGREDRSINRFSSKQRKSLNGLLLNVDKRCPIILMDHQPFQIEESVTNGVDVQISGHTHHGQLWPLNYITEAVYELSWGYKKDGDRHIYVSCGVGTWGPPVRLGNRPEIIKMKLEFD